MAADRGHAVAQYNLGNGSRRMGDFSEAARLYGLAAAQGDTVAQYALAKFHEKCRGVPVNLGEAKRLYALAAAKGHEDAKVALAELKALENMVAIRTCK